MGLFMKRRKLFQQQYLKNFLWNFEKRIFCAPNNFLGYCFLFSFFFFFFFFLCVCVCFLCFYCFAHKWHICGVLASTFLRITRNADIVKLFILASDLLSHTRTENCTKTRNRMSLVFSDMTISSFCGVLCTGVWK